MIPHAHYFSRFQRFCSVIVVCSISFLRTQPTNGFLFGIPASTASFRSIHRRQSWESTRNKSCKTPLQQYHRHPQSQRLQPMPKVVVEGSYNDNLLEDIIAVLQHCGFDATIIATPPQQQQPHNNDQEDRYVYKFVKATGMLQLIRQPTTTITTKMIPPKWIPIVKGMEFVLVSNGWSFLDPDPSEPESPFDFDIGNTMNTEKNINAKRGQYIPPWQEHQQQ